MRDPRRVSWGAVLGVTVWFLCTDGHAYAEVPPAPLTVLGIHESQFTLNGEPTFLLGVSYYGGLGASREFVQQDLDDLQAFGVNWIRVWATWSAYDHDVSAVDAQGQVREPFMQSLQWLVAECDRRGMVVDVTLTRRAGAREAVIGGLADAEAHRLAVEALVGALQPHRNWYLDLANERDVRDDRYVSIEELKSLRELVRRLDPRRVVTASFGGHDLSNDDVRYSLVEAGHDVLAVHRPRHAKSPQQTEARTGDLLARMAEIHRTAPVHHQEPFRRGYADWEPTVDDFLTDLRGARAGGAAGWCLHNGAERTRDDGQPRRSFDLHEHRLLDQFDDVERRVLEQMAAVLAETASAQ
jgi:hypothetical protein